jgi:hypothetical protein
VLVINDVLLGWSITHDGTREIATYALHISFCLYILGLALRSINQNTQSLHSESLIHLTALITLALLLLSSIAILPDSPPITASVETIPALWYLWHARLVLYMMTLVTTITTRRGPPLRYPLDWIYAEKTVLAASSAAEENVSGSVGMHIRVMPRI